MEPFYTMLLSTSANAKCFASAFQVGSNMEQMCQYAMRFCSFLCKCASGASESYRCGKSPQSCLVNLQQFPTHPYNVQVTIASTEDTTLFLQSFFMVILNAVKKCKEGQSFCTSNKQKKVVLVHLFHPLLINCDVQFLVDFLCFAGISYYRYGSQSKILFTLPLE